MGRAFEELGWEVTSLDVDSKAQPHHLRGHLQLGAAAQLCSRLFRHDLGQPSMRRVQQGADATSQTVGGGRQAGAADFASHPRVTAPVLGNRKPGHRPAQAPPLHGWLALAGCQLLHLRLPLSQAHQGLGQLGLDARATRVWHWRLPNRTSQSAPLVVETDSDVTVNYGFNNLSDTKVKERAAGHL